MKWENPRERMALIAIPLALLSVIIVALIRHKDHLRDTWGVLILGAWTIFPSIWFLYEWIALRHTTNTEDLKHVQDLVRNIWVAFVVILTAILFGKWPLSS
jgi:hypothetical protein